jgi:RNA polymerase sigma-70 factor, ECF subfamily
MSTSLELQRTADDGWSDEDVVAQVLGGNTAAFEILMRRYNQRLYRVLRSILRDDSEAEDVMQEAYVRAYQHLNQFAGRAKFSTWLTRIAVNEALARLRHRARFTTLDIQPGSDGGSMTELSSTAPSPEEETVKAEAKSLLEQAILALPESYRTILLMRDVEGMSTAESAECLDITEENVKIRLYRARALMRKQLYSRVSATSSAAFQFMGPRCDRVVKAVFERLHRLERRQPIS